MPCVVKLVIPRRIGRILLLLVTGRTSGVHRGDLLGDHTLDTGDRDLLRGRGWRWGRLRSTGHQRLRGGGRIHVVIRVEGDIHQWIREGKSRYIDNDLIVAGRDRLCRSHRSTSSGRNRDNES